ncbi:hypothetical protein B5808_02175 [Cnuibacter physcomitrellae]|uniref:Uncharacterized protein n=1 Tax=Cnuibacter physcomitrellae TaxID=1619308 RepID=A0A1X9LG32_9MICO|nr:hypothetical protein B5808_02175 [Cnuibacter physcomitrellae]
MSPGVAVAIFQDSRETVDTIVTHALATGGTEPRPAADYGSPSASRREDLLLPRGHRSRPR